MDDSVSTLVNVRAIATRVRRALEDLPEDKWPSTWTSFPGGTCGDTSLVLGAFLADAGFGGFEYVSGEGERREEDGICPSHAWLQRDQLVVDITADQFADGPGPVVVAENPEWHHRFRVMWKDAGDFREHPSKHVGAARQLYDFVKAWSDADTLRGS